MPQPGADEARDVQLTAPGPDVEVLAVPSGSGYAHPADASSAGNLGSSPRGLVFVKSIRRYVSDAFMHHIADSALVYENKQFFGGNPQPFRRLGRSERFVSHARLPMNCPSRFYD